MEVRMQVQYTNRRGQTYFLHEGKTRGGKPSLYFSTKAEGNPAAAVPTGYEIYEKPHGQVFLRKSRPCSIRDEELALVRDLTRRLAGTSNLLVQAEGDDIIVHAADPPRITREMDDAFGGMGALLAQQLAADARLDPALRFTLADAATRRFSVSRWCYRGGTEHWTYPLDDGPLEAMVRKFAPHVGKESFFDLM
jgi:hypothetical protein